MAPGMVPPQRICKPASGSSALTSRSCASLRAVIGFIAHPPAIARALHTQPRKPFGNRRQRMQHQQIGVHHRQLQPRGAQAHAQQRLLPILHRQQRLIAVCARMRRADHRQRGGKQGNPRMFQRQPRHRTSPMPDTSAAISPSLVPASR
jgi:hypothetical protein